MKFNRVFLVFIPTILLFLASWGPTATIERYDYEVIVYNRSIGIFSAVKTELNGRQDYRLTTALSTRIIKTITFDLIMLSSFQNSKLIHADLKRYWDHKLMNSSTVDFDGSKYLIKTEKETLTHNQSSVSYSSAILYFREPVGITEMFSENFGVNLPVEKAGDHRYKVTLPNGDRNYYQYLNGKVISAEFDKSLVNIKLKRISN